MERKREAEEGRRSYTEKIKEREREKERGREIESAESQPFPEPGRAAKKFLLDTETNTTSLARWWLNLAIAAISKVRDSSQRQRQKRQFSFMKTILNLYDLNLIFFISVQKSNFKFCGYLFLSFLNKIISFISEQSPFQISNFYHILKFNFYVSHHIITLSFYFLMVGASQHTHPPLHLHIS